MSKILIVDDSQVMRDGMAQLLHRLGYDVSTAKNGKVAWLSLYAELPDLIILDLMMPEMGGVTFLRMLRAHHHWHQLPVLVITGLDHDESLVQDARAFGVLDVIRKGGGSIDRMLGRISDLFPGHADVKISIRERVAFASQFKSKVSS